MVMNGRQAAKAAAKRIEEQEHTLALNKADIRDYNQVILDLIGGKSPCDYCEDLNECQLQAKTDGTGCSEWMLRSQTPETMGPPASTKVVASGEVPAIEST